MIRFGEENDRVGEGQGGRDREKGEGLETYKQKKTEGKKILNIFKKINIWVISSP